MDMRYRQNLHTAGRVIDGQAFVVTPKDNRMHSLNETATRLWQLAKHGCTAEDVVTMLTSEFEVDGETARADVQTCIDDLLAREILLVDDKSE